jgi:hypothetical protein
VTSSPCLGPELALDGGGCMVASNPNTATGPMTYDSGGVPIQLESPSWPYPCPIAGANGLMDDPDAGLWQAQPMPTWTEHAATAPGAYYTMAANAWKANTPVGTFTLANPTCLPLQVVVSATVRAALTLQDGHYAQMVAWLGQGALTNPQYYPQYATAHIDDPDVPGAVPFCLCATITRRVSLPASGSVRLNTYQGIYHNYHGNAASAAPYSVSGIHPAASIEGGDPPAGGIPVGVAGGNYVTAFSVELFAQGWPSLYPVSDG